MWWWDQSAWWCYLCPCCGSIKAILRDLKEPPSGILFFVPLSARLATHFTGVKSLIPRPSCDRWSWSNPGNSLPRYYSYYYSTSDTQQGCLRYPDLASFWQPAVSTPQSLATLEIARGQYHQQKNEQVFESRVITSVCMIPQKKKIIK